MIKIYDEEGPSNIKLFIQKVWLNLIKPSIGEMTEKQKNKT